MSFATLAAPSALDINRMLCAVASCLLYRVWLSFINAMRIYWSLVWAAAGVFVCISIQTSRIKKANIKHLDRNLLAILKPMWRERAHQILSAMARQMIDIEGTEAMKMKNMERDKTWALQLAWGTNIKHKSLSDNFAVFIGHKLNYVSETVRFISILLRFEAALKR